MIEIIIILFIIFSKSNCPNIIKYIFGLIGIVIYIKKRDFKLKEHITLSQLRAQTNRKLKDKRAIFIRSDKISMDELSRIASKISQKLDISSLLEIEERISYKSKINVINYGFVKDKCYDNPNTIECKNKELNNVYIIIKTEYADTKLRDDYYANTKNYSKMYRGIIPENRKSLNRSYLHYYFKKYIKILNLDKDILVSYG